MDSQVRTSGRLCVYIVVEYAVRLVVGALFAFLSLMPYV